MFETMSQRAGRYEAYMECHRPDKQTNKNLRCGNRKGLLGRNDQTHHMSSVAMSVPWDRLLSLKNMCG